MGFSRFDGIAVGVVIISIFCSFQQEVDYE